MTFGSLGPFPAYVEQQRVNINLRFPDRISMPEIFDMVRTNVPGGTELDPSQIARIVQDIFGGVRIPEHQRDRSGVDEELTARVRNALPSIPRELTIVEGISSNRPMARPLQPPALDSKPTATGTSITSGQIESIARFDPGQRR